MAKRLNGERICAHAYLLSWGNYYLFVLCTVFLYCCMSVMRKQSVESATPSFHFHLLVHSLIRSFFFDFKHFCSLNWLVRLRARTHIRILFTNCFHNCGTSVFHIMAIMAEPHTYTQTTIHFTVAINWLLLSTVYPILNTIKRSIE